ncbi:hypothetical protein [Caulobacter sp. FWC26]|nr:hypothetical protein [Caulobacter sp. FWC26]
MLNLDTALLKMAAIAFERVVFSQLSEAEKSALRSAVLLTRMSNERAQKA